MQCLFGFGKNFVLMCDSLVLGCQCIRFRSTFGKEWGQFSSPDYPGGGGGTTSPIGIPCLLYSFRGPVHSIVEVRLEKVQLPTNGKSDGGNGGDGSVSRK